MKIITTLALTPLLLFTGTVLAQRPAMSEQPYSSTQQVPVGDNSDSFRPGADPSPEPEPMPELVPEPIAETPPAEPAPEPMSEPIPEPSEATETMTQQSGDVLEMQAGDTVPVKLLTFPKRGMLMDKVKNELGPPAEIKPAVGEPPITIWVYPDRKVYFEYSHVIHAVANN